MKKLSFLCTSPFGNIKSLLDYLVRLKLVVTSDVFSHGRCNQPVSVNFLFSNRIMYISLPKTSHVRGIGYNIRAAQSLNRVL